MEKNKGIYIKDEHIEIIKIALTYYHADLKKRYEADDKSDVSKETLNEFILKTEEIF